jgi:hypothetical protein
MVQELLLAGKAKDLAEVLKTYRVPSDTHTLMLLEMQPQRIVEPYERQKLLHFAHFDPDDCAGYISGRIFHKYGELRWEKQDGAVQIIYTGHKHYNPEIDVTHTIQLDSCKSVTRNYFLFGKRLDDHQLTRIGPPAQAGDFAEARIPRLLRYPALEDAERVKLVVHEYFDRTTGGKVAFRFADLVGAEERR